MIDHLLNQYASKQSPRRLRVGMLFVIPLLALYSLLNISGCRTSQKSVASLPVQHSVQTDQLLIMSNVRLSADHPLIRDLQNLRQRVVNTLQLPPEGRSVTVYLFSSEPEYRKYFSQRFPGLPHRRAYFVGTPHELAVYTHFGQRVQEDLRHEFTHGLLHAHLMHVPLWMDEGLAEYFEVAGPVNGGLHSEYSVQLGTATNYGWKPNLVRLEQLQRVSQMGHEDYREAWGWIHFLMHGTPEGRQVLLKYIQELRENPNPGTLNDRLKYVLPLPETQFATYANTLNLR